VTTVRSQGHLRIAVGFASSTGRRPDNQDFGVVDFGSHNESALQGIVAVVADGAGGGNGGRVASELAARTFIDGYRCQNALTGIGPAALKVLEGYNSWLHAQAQIAPSLRGAATTFTAAVLRGRLATVVHLGDSRAWHFRSGALTPLTDDHVSLQADGGQRLVRALGLEPSLRLDLKSQPIEAHDRLLLSTDGVHQALRTTALIQLLGRRQASQADAEAIVEAAIREGGHDNATAIIVDIIETPTPDYSALTAEMETLPVRAPPLVGEVVDGFELVRQIAESKTAHIFLAKDGNELAVLKFPKAEACIGRDRHRFMREVFLGQRINNVYVGRSLPLAEGRQSRLYVASPFYKGETLEDRLRRGPMRIDETISIACQVGRGLSALHRLGVAHRDVKPQNIMLLDTGEVKIIDIGVARLPGFEDDLDEPETPGTADFMAPELFAKARGDALSDQYALGVTLYRMLTAHYPFGETLPGGRPLIGPVAPITRYRGDVPAWLNATVLRAISLRPEDRFGDVHELVFELEHGKARAAPVGGPRPLIERNPVMFWQLLCLVLAVLLGLSLFVNDRDLSHVMRSQTPSLKR
jgi:serine/threonine protein phosphatase PrpC